MILKPAAKRQMEFRVRVKYRQLAEQFKFAVGRQKLELKKQKTGE